MNFHFSQRTDGERRGESQRIEGGIGVRGSLPAGPGGGRGGRRKKCAERGKRGRRAALHLPQGRDRRAADGAGARVRRTRAGDLPWLALRAPSSLRAAQGRKDPHL